MTILEIILVVTHIFAIVAGYAAGKQDGIQQGRADMYEEIAESGNVVYKAKR